MASAQVTGTYIIKVRSPKGSEVEIFRGRSEYIGNGGSSDGSISNSPEKWAVLPLTRAPTPSGYFQGGDQVILAIIPDAGATLDISDARFIIPLTLENGSVRTLANNATDFAQYTDQNQS